MWQFDLMNRKQEIKGNKNSYHHNFQLKTFWNKKISSRFDVLINLANV